jgi:uncharacterized protein
VSAVARENKPPRVFLDSNVIFSGLHSPGGAPGAVLKLMLDRKIKVVISRQILEEVVRTFKKKLPAALPALNRFFLNSPLEVVGDPSPDEFLRLAETLKEGDASILAAAVAANPDFFVTGDCHFLDNPQLKRKSGLVICTPAQLLEGMGLEQIN